MHKHCLGERQRVEAGQLDLVSYSRTKKGWDGGELASMSTSTLNTHFPSLVLLKQKSNLITSSGSTPSMTPHCPQGKSHIFTSMTLHLILFPELLIHPSCILAPATLNSLLFLAHLGILHCPCRTALPLYISVA